MARVNLRLLGGFEVRIESGPPLTLPTRKSQALLAYLALSAGTAHPRDKLTALLWGDSGDRQARHSLRQALSTLRKLEILVEGEHVTLDPAAVAADAVTFERLVRTGTPPELEAAVELYRGDLLEGLPLREPAFEEWLVAERERLRELAQEALARLVTLHDRRGALDVALRAAQRLVALDPLQEAAHRALMRLYARGGRRGAALRQYQACLDILQRELGAEPEEETRQLYHDLLRRRRAAADVAPAPAAVTLLPAPPSGRSLVGRDEPLARLTAAFERARTGHGVVAAVVGEAGVGKSRLVEELAAAALAQGARVVTGRAYEMEGALPLGPWIDAIQLDRALPGLWPSEAPPAGTQGDSLRLFEAVARVLGHLASAGPLLVVLEDLHWADEMSLSLLSFVSRRVAGWAVMVVVTAREEELTPSLARRLQGLDEQGLLTVRLGRLSRAATLALVRALARPGRRESAQERLGSQVWLLSEGNPFMVVEAVRAAAEAGRARRAGRLPLPARIRSLVLARVERASERAQRLVAAAAVIGREFEFTLLWRVGRLSERQTAEGVEELVRRGLLRASGELLEFTHDSIRQSAYERLLEPTRRELHRATAEALEAFHADRLEAVHDQLAHHHAQGGDSAKALPYLVLSAEAAERRYAVTDAVRTLEQAREHAERLPPADRDRHVLDVSLRLATALSTLGAFGDILKLLHAQRETVDRLGDPALAGVYHFRLALTQSLVGSHEEARRAARRALDEAQRAGDSATSARAHYVLAVEGFSTGQALDGVEHGRQAVTLLEPLDERRWLSLAWWVVGLNHLVLGELDAALDAEERAEAFGRAVEDRGLESFAVSVMAWIHLTGRDWDRAQAAARRGVEQSPDPATRFTAQALLAYAEVAGPGERGAVAARGARTIEQAIEHLGQFKIRQTLLLAYLAEIQILRGDLERAQEAATRGLTLAREIRFAWGLGSSQRLLGRVAAARGDLAAARGHLDDALATFETIAARLEVARTRAALDDLTPRAG